MASTAPQRLKVLVDSIVAERRASTSDCVLLLVLARECLEDTDPSRFATVRFYGDWCVHSRLDRRAAIDKLEQLDALMRSEEDGAAIDWPVAVSDVLGPETLRAELRELLTSLDIATVLVNDPINWRGIMSQVLTNLLDKPLEGGAFTSEEEATGWGTRPRALRLVADPTVAGSPIQWELQLGPRVFVRGAFGAVTT